ncbi:MAG: methyltransferase domain-containing protein [bacterium]|jgi:malonyl-CoA O-methyltransferase
MTSVANRFSRAAQTYERGASLHRHVAARLIETLPEPGEVGSGRILEVGCGSGILTEPLRQRYPEASFCVLDVAEGMVAAVRSRWGHDPRMEFVVADVREFSTPRPFDLMVSSSALHWATPLEGTFANLKRHLFPEGKCYVALMIDGTLAELHALRRRVAPGKIPAGRLSTAAEVLEAARAAGFTVVTSEEESIQTRYHSADDFLSTIHAQGLTGGAVSRASVSLTRTELKRLRREYDVAFRGQGDGVFASFVVQYLSLRL